MAGVVAWYRRSAHPVGCRDRYTYEELRGLGLRAELVHCATLTLPRYGGPRSGICVVDFPLGEDDARCLADRLGEPVRRLSHRLLGPAAHRGFAYEWSRGLELLETYRRAALVITGRLHALLPCLAFGTPVIFQGDAWDGPYESNPRFSIARELGLRPGIVVGDVDTTAISARYLDFLRRGRVTVDPIPELTDLPLPLAA